jgi:mRNA-degrading endonuclease RelE of RelBE toxin-antitoxin system
MSSRYDIRYAAEAVEDIRALRAFDQRKVLDGIEEHLARQPGEESKSRIRAMAQPFWSQYRLRIDDFRVYYDVDAPQHTVNVLQVLKKGSASTPQAPF